MLNETQYVAKQGIVCPCCEKSTGLNASSTKYYGDVLLQYVTCTCGASWEDVYTLTGFQNLERK